jgi:eukaryotic-like serine/threonine-protein kinase
MPLTEGDRLGGYEIVALLGYGGMGEVYRARDTRLGREVAIKILPAAFANDPDRLARLEREARLISQVNHPNVCTLFHIGDAFEPHETHFLVLELVEGETLHQRLIRGPLELHEALRYAADIAAALDAAHAKGIIHRDLKPSNIKIAAGRTLKVLDFGVAKLAEEIDTPHTSPLVTATLGGTREGALIGTVAYISPEQAMGETVDKRTDIWAFGCVLYEMLTAKRAFPGLAVADTLANVMRGEPNWTILPAPTPQAIRKLLERCLQKDRKRRLADIGDARLEINDALSPTPAIAYATRVVRPSRGGFKTVLAFVAGIAVTVFVLGALDFFLKTRDNDPSPRNESLVPQVDIPPVPVAAPSTSTSKPALPPVNEQREPSRTVLAPARISINPPEDVRWTPSPFRDMHNSILAISPDGQRIVYMGQRGDTTSLWLQAIDGSNARELPGTQGGSSPFWSPDGASIGFFTSGALKRLDIAGMGEPITLCAVTNSRGATWGPDDTIVFAGYSGRWLEQVSAKGGIPARLTYLAPGEPHHVRPHFLAGTRHLLYRVTGTNARNNAYYVMTLGSPDRKLLMTVDSGNVMYARQHLLFVHNGALMAQPFDLAKLSIVGDPVRIVDRIRVSMVAPPRFGIFSVSQTDRIAYLSADSGDVPMTILTSWSALMK